MGPLPTDLSGKSESSIPEYLNTFLITCIERKYDIENQKQVEKTTSDRVHILGLIEKDVKIGINTKLQGEKKSLRN